MGKESSHGTTLSSQDWASTIVGDSANCWGGSSAGTGWDTPKFSCKTGYQDKFSCTVVITFIPFVH